MAERKIRYIYQPNPGWAQLCDICTHQKQPLADFAFPCDMVSFRPYGWVPPEWRGEDDETIDMRGPDMRGPELIRYIVGNRHHRRFVEECSSFKKRPTHDEVREEMMRLDQEFQQDLMGSVLGRTVREIDIIS